MYFFVIELFKEQLDVFNISRFFVLRLSFNSSSNVLMTTLALMPSQQAIRMLFFIAPGIDNILSYDFYGDLHNFNIITEKRNNVCIKLSITQQEAYIYVWNHSWSEK